MHKLKCLTAVIAFLSISCSFAEPDISVQQRLELLENKVLSEGVEGKMIYVSKEPLASAGIVESWLKPFTVPEFYNKAWFYFIDDMPEANWEHKCRYIFIETKTGEYQIEEGKTPPKNINEMIKLYPRD